MRSRGQGCRVLGAEEGEAGTPVTVWVSEGLVLTCAPRGGISAEGPEHPRVELVGQQKGPGWPSAHTRPPGALCTPAALLH